MGILLIFEILRIILDVQGYIGNFGSVGVFGSFSVFKGILVILEVKRNSSSFRGILVILS